MPGPILLFGAAGQVGSALAPALARLGDVKCVVRADADLEEPAQLRSLVRRVAPRLIVNAAAYTAVDDAERDAERCRRVNADAPKVLAEESARLGAPLVHFSTNYVFDGEATEPYREDDPVSPLGVYGLTKAVGEQAVATANPAHLILRTSGVYAKTGRNFMLRILALARERDELQVVDDQFVAPTSASLVAEATVAAVTAAMARGEGSHLFGTYHLTTSGATSWLGFAERILALDPQPETQRARRLRGTSSADFPTPARRPKNGLLNTDAFARAFDFPLPTWDDELRRTMARLAAPV